MATQGINFLVAFLLMLYLSPSDFGKFAMVFVVVRFLQIFREAGLTVSLIQKKKLSITSLSTAFWFQVLLAVLISSFLIFSGEFFNDFYEETVLSTISFWLSIDFIIGSIGLVPTALLRKEMDFKQLFKIQIVAVMLSSLCGIIMALNGMGYLSLVGKCISWTTINSLGTFIVVKWKPRVQFSIKELRSLLKIGLPDTGNYILWYLTMNVDDFFIGRVIGSTPLGFYNRAYTIMLLPIVNITSVIQGVLFSTWSKMQEDTVRIGSMYLKISGIIALFAFPSMTLLSIFSKPIIETVFGQNWLSMATTLSILSIIGMFQSVSALLGVVFIVFNKNIVAFKINIISSIFTISLMTWSIYTYKSIEITSLIYGITSLIITYPRYYLASKIMKISIKEFMEPLIYPFILSMVIGLIGYGVFQVFPDTFTSVKLFVSILFSCVIYVILCIVIREKSFLFFVKTVKDYRNN